jgi:hypothetical protein
VSATADASMAATRLSRTGVALELLIGMSEVEFTNSFR